MRVFKKLLILLLVTFIIRLPSLFEPFWYGDEGIYFSVADLLDHHRLLYTQAFDNKPPFIYLLTAFSTHYLGHSLWSLRMVLMIWVLLTVVVIYFLTKKLFEKENIALLGASFFALLSSTPLFEGFIANGEIFMILGASLGMLLALQKRYFLAGIFFAFGVLFKFPALFDLAAFGVFLFITELKALSEKQKITINYLVKSLEKPLLLTTGFILPLAITTLYFLFKGRFSDFYFATLGSNVGYTNIGNNFIISNGLLIVKLVPLLILSAWFWWKGKKESFPFYLVLLWLSFSLYGALFSGRSYPHYLMQTVPPLAILLALIIMKKEFRVAFLGSLAMFLAVVIFFGFQPAYLKLSYYENFFRYVTGSISQEQYESWFDSKTPRDYNLAAYIQKKTTPNDYIFIWSNNAQIYFLSDRLAPLRFIAAYHIDAYHAYQEANEALITKQPKLILIERPYPYPYPELDKIILNSYNQVGKIQDVDIYELRNSQTL